MKADGKSIKMDLRKIQVTGGSSYMVTLPKDWADSIGLKKNDTVGLQPQADGSMIIYPGGETAASKGSVKRIDTEGITDRDLLYRMLVGAYIAGHGTIAISSDSGISSTVANVASSFTQTAIGLEIMDESDDTIVIKDLMDQGEMRPARSVERMKVLVRNMLEDIIEGMETRKVDLLVGMSDRDREVDRLDWLISRQVNIHQRDITISRRMGMDLCEITRCSSISRALERIGDHAVLLAGNFETLMDDDTGIDRSITELARNVVALMVDSVGTWSSKDMFAANTCIVRGEELAASAAELAESADGIPGKRGIAAELIAGSVKRIAEYSMDICEIAINSAMDRRRQVYQTARDEGFREIRRRYDGRLRRGLRNKAPPAAGGGEAPGHV